MLPADQTSQSLPEDEMQMLTRVANRLSVMGHPARLMIIGFLKRQGEAPVSSIAEQLGLPLASASQHLKTMERVGLLKYRRDGRQIYYSFRLQMAAEICDILCHHLERETADHAVERVTFERLMGHMQG